MNGATVLLLVLCTVFKVFAQDSENYRLPIIVIPSNYDIEITPYFVPEPNKLQFTFDGIARITLRTTNPNIMQIVLHAVNLNTTTNPTLVEAQDGFTSIQVTGSIDTLRTQKRTLTLASALKANQDYILTFNYVGQINAGMHGFYRSSYVENGTTKWTGTTQMEATYARMVFPCFDEPSFKATFDIKLNRPNSWQPSISNTRLTSSTNAGTRTRETFRRTPKMSTYLIAFIFSEFRLRENINRSVGVLSRPDAFSQTQYALSIAQETLSKLDEWTGYRYMDVPEIEKMHLAALPDFDAGAMENWGLLTFRETALLYDPDVSTDLAQQKVACTIAHEQAHMWFGDLVTCDWWKYLWLNEAFGRFFQYFGTAMVETSWNLEQQFVVDITQYVLYRDSLTTTHPMTNDVYTPGEIDDMFNYISYDKGASIVRMIQHLIGAASFQAAMRTYLKTNEFSTTTPEKFYFALQAQAGTTMNIASLMNTWTNQSGYPVVTIERQSNVTYLVSQQRFLLKTRIHTDATLWEIPLNYASPNESFTSTNARFMLERTERSKIVQMQTDTPWKIFNIQQTGYYRVNYDNNTWTAIGNALKEDDHSGIHVLNRAQIVDDILMLARGEWIDYYQALSIVQYLEKEENYIPWKAALRNLEYVSERLSITELVKYRKYILALTKNVYTKLHFTQKSTDTRLDIYNRGKILSEACKFGHEECINTAKEEFAKFETTTYRVPANIRPVVYCTAIAEGGQAEWDFLWKKYHETKVAAERNVILMALGCGKTKSVLENYLDLILTDDIRLQDKDDAFESTYAQRIENVPIVLEYIYNNFGKISSLSKEGMGQVSYLLSNLAKRFTNEAQIERLQSFYTAHSLEFHNSRSIPNAIEDARYNIEWAQKHVPTIISYLDDIQAGSASLNVSITLILASMLAYFY